MQKALRQIMLALLPGLLGLGLAAPQAQAQLLGSLVVNMSSPASGSTVSGTVPVSANVTIVGSLVVRGVQFKLDGANLGAMDSGAPYSVSWNTAGAANGTHTLAAVAYDFLGGQWTSNSVTVTVSNAPPPPPPDTTPPSVSISSPASGATVSGTINITANASDNVGVAGVQFQLDGANAGAEDTTAPYSVPWDTTKASDGSHTITAVARDAAGNRSTSAPVTVTVSNGSSSDTTPPTVSISSPASGATVSGTITVSANASDNVGVAGVQFQLDGANAGSELTAPPYSVPWDTTKASDGSHTITAVARDAAGNRATSAPVTVTVSNNAPPPPPPGVKRYEESDPSVAFSSGWTLDSSRSWSGGAAAVTSTAGERATITFTGTSVSWIGGRSPGTGIASVLVDGTRVAQVDTYSKTEEIRVPMYTVNGLANSSHTLTIEATGQANSAASGALIVVDAFDVPGPAVSRLQETDPDIAYTSGWTQGDPSRAWSQGLAATSATAGAQATLSFTGTSITWIGARSPETGIATVYLDGAAVADVDTYAPTEQIQQAVFTATGLSNTAHTLTIKVSGTKNSAASSDLIVVDGFEVTSPGAQYQDTDPAIAYSSGWSPDNRDRAYNQGSAAESDTTGATATFSFTGTGISWIGGNGPQTGTARVYLDGAAVADVDTYSPTEGIQHTDFSASGLARGSHTLTIEVTGKNPASSDAWILVDAFDVRP
ncbi:MAG: Ig-like domain-containing protein [Burkholderiales bacterium]